MRQPFSPLADRPAALSPDLTEIATPESQVSDPYQQHIWIVVAVVGRPAR
jgi:hypothetical protein